MRALLLLLALVIIALAGFFVARRRMAGTRLRIRVVDGPDLEVSAGSNLFFALRDGGVGLPSTCGGQGACAQCRCRVLRGADRITDQERPYFSEAEIKAHWRLACRVTVQRDIVVELPERRAV